MKSLLLRVAQLTYRLAKTLAVLALMQAAEIGNRGSSGALQVYGAGQ